MSLVLRLVMINLMRSFIAVFDPGTLNESFESDSENDDGRDSDDEDTMEDLEA